MKEPSDRISTQMGSVPTVSLQITSRCNLGCRDCREPGRDGAKDMDEGMAESLVEQAGRLGAEVIRLSGGEPLLRPALVEQIAVSSGATVVVETDGALLDDDMAGRLARTGKVTLAIGVEGTPELTDARRGSGADAALERAAAMCCRAGLRFGVRLGIDRDGAKALSDDGFLERWKARGAGFIALGMHAACSGRLDPQRLPTAADREVVLAAARRWKLGRRIEMQDGCLDASSTGGCPAGANLLHVRCDGRIQPCQHVPLAMPGDGSDEPCLASALGSDLFERIRDNQPCDTNLLRPCMMVDHPDVARMLADRCDAFVTDERAFAVITDKKARALLDAHASQWCRIADSLWRGPGWECGRRSPGPSGRTLDVWRMYPERMQSAVLVTALRKATGQGFHPRHATRIALPSIPDLPPLAA